MGREEDSGSGDPEVPVCILGLINWFSHPAK